MKQHCTAEATARSGRVTTAGQPQEYGVGTCVLVEAASAWLYRDTVGFYAIDAQCPHLGCVVRVFEDGFLCPCHQSHFDAAGARVTGPTPRSLQYFYIELDAAGLLIIRRDRPADPNDRLIA